VHEHSPEVPRLYNTLRKRFKRKPKILKEIPAKSPYRKIARMLEIRILKALKRRGSRVDACWPAGSKSYEGLVVGAETPPQIFCGG
jgi:hypothetical protein